jgi:LEA14-like dessication related protein
MKNLHLLLFVLFFAACASAPPAPEYEPGGTLGFERIEAGGEGRCVLYFSVRAQNPRSLDALWTLEEGSLFIDGVEYKGESTFVFPEPFYVEAGGEAVALLTLDLDLLSLKEFADNGADSFEALLSVRAQAAYGSGSPFTFSIEGKAQIPRYREPRFSITSIAVSQAELINTRLRVSLKIENPNPFPLELSSFSYELYGSGRFWADGALKDLLVVPPKGSAETSLALIMNFINMRRELLNQVIEMRQVRYRFKGDALVGSSLEYLPAFPLSFDLSGNSPVVE